MGTRVWSLSGPSGGSTGGMGTGANNGIKGRGGKGSGSGSLPLNVRKLDLPVSLSQEFSQALAFSADGRRLAAYCPLQSATGTRASSQSARAILRGSLVLLSLVDAPPSSNDDPSDEEEDEEEEEEDEEEGNSRKKKKRLSHQKKQAAKRAKRQENKSSSSSSSSSSNGELMVTVWHTFDHALNVRNTNGGSSSGSKASNRGGNSGRSSNSDRGGGGAEYGDDGLEYVVSSMVFSPDGLWCVVASCSHVVSCYVMSCYVMSCYVCSYYIISCHFVPYHIILYRVISYRFISYHVN